MKSNKIAIIGSPYHGEKISQVLEQSNLNCKIEKLSKNPIKYIRTILSSDVFFLVFAHTSYKFIIFFLIPAWLLKKRLYIEWIGSDVLDLMQSKRRNLKGKLFNRLAVNLCECQWICDELKDCGVTAKVGPYISFSTLFKKQITLKKESPSTAINKNFICTTYAGQGRESLYSIPEIIEVVKDMQYVELHILGHNGENQPRFKNVFFHGWVSQDEVLKIYNKTDLFIRFTKHDGLSYSVLEAMSLGLNVAYSYNLPETFLLKSKDSLKEIIEKLNMKKNETGDISNNKAKNYIYKNFIENKTSENNLTEIFR